MSIIDSLLFYAVVQGEAKAVPFYPHLPLFPLSHSWNKGSIDLQQRNQPEVATITDVSHIRGHFCNKVSIGTRSKRSLRITDGP